MYPLTQLLHTVRDRQGLLEVFKRLSLREDLLCDPVLDGDDVNIGHHRPVDYDRHEFSVPVERRTRGGDDHVDGSLRSSLDNRCLI